MYKKDRVRNGFRAMKAIGFSADKVRPAFRKLLISYNKNWPLIESDNYRALTHVVRMSNKDVKPFLASMRVENAYCAMKAIGISEDKVKPVLKDLLKLYRRNWAPIERENYKALADAIFDSEESKVETALKKLKVYDKNRVVVEDNNDIVLRDAVELSDKDVKAKDAST